MNSLKNPPKISIGMPVYNGRDLIRDAIDSVLSQTYSNFELIISDNASTDGTDEICLEYEKRDSRIRFIKQDNNCGGEGNFRIVLGEAVGEYFKWMAHDDYIDPGFLEKIVSYLDKNPDVVSCVSDVILDRSILGGSLDIVSIDILRDNKKWMNTISPILLSLSPYFCGNNAFYAVYGVHRRRLVQNIYSNMGFITRIIADEYPFLTNLALKGRIVSLEEVLWKYRRHSGAECEVNKLYYSRANLFFRHNMLNEIYKCRMIYKSQLSFSLKYSLITRLVIRQPYIIYIEFKIIFRRLVRNFLIHTIGLEKANSIKNYFSLFFK